MNLEIAKEHERLIAFIQTLEEHCEVELADKKRKELAKLKSPAVLRPTQDRASLMARLAELKEKSEKQMTHEGDTVGDSRCSRHVGHKARPHCPENQGASNKRTGS